VLLFCFSNLQSSYRNFTEGYRKFKKNHNTSYREKTGVHWISLIFYQISCAEYQVYFAVCMDVSRTEVCLMTLLLSSSDYKSVQPESVRDVWSQVIRRAADVFIYLANEAGLYIS
jgi:hypothetical protein